MKTTIIGLAFLLIRYTSFSQNIEPAQHPFNIFGNSSYLVDAEDNNFRQNRVQTGFIWSGDNRFNEVIGAYSHMAYYNYPDTYVQPEFFSNNSDMLFQIPGISHHYFPTPFNNISIQYEPTLYINQVGKFKTRDGDDTKPVFGFKSIYNNGNFILSSDRRLKLTQNMASNYPLTVLNEPWPSEKSNGGIKRYEDNTTNDADITYINDYGTTPTFKNREKNGAEYYLSINLRRTSGNEQNNDVVLRITLPYESGSLSGDIRFACIPDPEDNDNDNPIINTSLNENRGRRRNVVDISPQQTTIEITKKMIPLNSTDITISALFKCYGFPNTNNPENLTKLGINVEYMGNLDLEIDWIRIETPDSRRLFHGFYDSYIANGMQQALSHYTDVSYRNVPHNLRFFRVYLRDEIGMQHWGVTRYFNKFVGNIGISQTGSEYSKFFTYYTESPQVWTEEGAANRQTTCPYVRRGSEETNSQTMLLKLGFDFPNSGDITADSLNSSWEFYPYKDDYTGSYSDIRTCDLDDYYTSSGSYLKSFNRSQIYFEKLVYEQFYNYDKDFNLYGPGYFWYQNLTPVVEIYHDSPNNNHRLSFQYHRPFTGEELRLSMWTPIILGAKGLIYDGVGSEFAFSGEKK